MQIPIAMKSIWTQTVDMFKRGFMKSFSSDLKRTCYLVKNYQK